MASEYTIKMNFKKAKEQAAKLDEIAEEMGNLSSRDFSQTMQTVRNNWKGENADSYVLRGDRLEKKMTNTANSLHTVASEIRTIAERIYEAEMKALRIAQQRKYQ